MLENQVKPDQENVKNAVEIQQWLVNYMAELLEVEPKNIDITRSFDEYGLNSRDGIFLTGELEEWLGAELEPTLVYEYSTIKELAEYLG
ncbi:MAG: acyl carrier protein [Xenococcaceae cyanobacterium MO_167.B27]|nr:acyl carrier protein [Xenococcaceae cyanobacterium MO_167.B27]